MLFKGHKGDDGTYYILDTARLMPPEVPSGKGTFLYRLLRPEFVAEYGKQRPLCSDGYSGALNKDPAKNEHNQDIATACEYLQTKVVPDFAKWLDSEDIKSKNSFKELLHSKGINLRLIGLLWTHLTNPQWKSTVVEEMITRVCTGSLHILMRRVMQQVQIRLSEPYHVLAISYFNLVFGNSGLFYYLYFYLMK